MKRLKLTIISLAAAVVVTATPLAAPAGAINVWGSCSGANESTAVCKSKGDDLGNLWKSIISILLYILGAVSVIMIVIGGFKYVTSNGDSNNIQSAKNTILYAVIGLAVAICAQMIVLFVIDRL